MKTHIFFGSSHNNSQQSQHVYTFHIFNQTSCHHNIHLIRKFVFPGTLQHNYPPLKLTNRTWKWMLGILISFWGKRPIFKGKRTVSFRECIPSQHFFFGLNHQQPSTTHGPHHVTSLVLKRTSTSNNSKAASLLPAARAPRTMPLAAPEPFRLVEPHWIAHAIGKPWESWRPSRCSYTTKDIGITYFGSSSPVRGKKNKYLKT